MLLTTPKKTGRPKKNKNPAAVNDISSDREIEDLLKNSGGQYG